LIGQVIKLCLRRWISIRIASKKNVCDSIVPDFELSALVGNSVVLMISASTTISQYVIPVLAKFHQSSKEVKVVVKQ
jgi:hypothetical protein